MLVQEWTQCNSGARVLVRDGNLHRHMPGTPPWASRFAVAGVRRVTRIVCRDCHKEAALFTFPVRLGAGRRMA